MVLFADVDGDSGQGPPEKLRAAVRELQVVGVGTTITAA
jgi:hypothetical protein